LNGATSVLLSRGRVREQVESQKGAPMKENTEGYKEVFCRYITKNGKRIYPKNAEFFHFYVKVKTENVK
jgi:hypothetical protein